MTDHQRAVKRYADDNLVAANIIAATPTLYPEGSLMAQWADIVLSRAVDSQDAKAMALFEAAYRRRAA